MRFDSDQFGEMRSVGETSADALRSNQPVRANGKNHPALGKRCVCNVSSATDPRRYLYCPFRLPHARLSDIGSVSRP